MVGRKVRLQLDKARAAAGRGAARGRAPRRWSTQRGVRLLDDVGLELRAGEIVGIAGVSGNGQTELLQVLSGIRRADAAARSTVCGREIDARPSRRSGRDARPRRGPCAGGPPAPGHGGGVPAPRRPRSSAITSCAPFSRNYLLDGPAVGAHCAKLMERFDVRPRVPGLRSSNFSGGNQQKLVLAREMARKPKVLLVGQPTRGVDIGAIEFIHRELVKSRDAGCAVLVVSVELDEILSLADRILVMFAGRIVGEVDGGRADERTLGLMMAGRGAA